MLLKTLQILHIALVVIGFTGFLWLPQSAMPWMAFLGTIVLYQWYVCRGSCLLTRLEHWAAERELRRGQRRRHRRLYQDPEPKKGMFETFIGNIIQNWVPFGLLDGCNVNQCVNTLMATLVLGAVFVYTWCIGTETKFQLIM